MGPQPVGRRQRQGAGGHAGAVLLRQCADRVGLKTAMGWVTPKDWVVNRSRVLAADLACGLDAWTC